MAAQWGGVKKQPKMRRCARLVNSRFYGRRARKGVSRIRVRKNTHSRHSCSAERFIKRRCIINAGGWNTRVNTCLPRRSCGARGEHRDAITRDVALLSISERIGAAETKEGGVGGGVHSKKRPTAWQKAKTRRITLARHSLALCVHGEKSRWTFYLVIHFWMSKKFAWFCVTICERFKNILEILAGF